MTDQWVVSVGHTFYGPTESEETARDFAVFLTAEVDPAAVYKLHSPTRELLANYKTFGASRRYPDEWPPKPGGIWQDRDGNRWACSAHPRLNSYMFCLAHPGDDPAEEIWRRFGPLRLVASISPTEEEAPF